MAADVHRDLLRLLQRAGLRVLGGIPDMVLVTKDNLARPTRVKIYGQVLTAAMARDAVRRSDRPGRLLLAADSARGSLIEEAKTGAFDLVLAESGLVVVDGKVLLDAAGVSSTTGTHGRRVSWLRLAVQRVLAISDSPLKQIEIADRIGATQQAVSRVLPTLDHILRVDDGWIGDSGLLDRWLVDYPGPRGTQAHWYGLEPPAGQLRSARQLLTDLNVGSVLTGEMAADEYAPWMLPNTVRLYTEEIIDFTDAGFSPADPGDATMTIVIPDDPTIRAVAAATAQVEPSSYVDSVPLHLLADHAIVLWDLYNTSADPSAAEAAHRLRARIDADRTP
ncbi:hypothetical protein [Nocardia sp. CA-290969]|uniref:hypothetical protein n=1 Tax=Nocardia sp. CA-290969 TaxID=3239986 RepID=UPI003D8F9A29